MGYTVSSKCTKCDKIYYNITVPPIVCKKCGTRLVFEYNKQMDQFILTDAVEHVAVKRTWYGKIIFKSI